MCFLAFFAVHFHNDFLLAVLAKCQALGSTPGRLMAGDSNMLKLCICFDPDLVHIAWVKWTIIILLTCESNNYIFVWKVLQLGYSLWITTNNKIKDVLFCSVSSKNTAKDAPQTTADQKRKNQETKESAEGKFWGKVNNMQFQKIFIPSPCTRSLKILIWGVRRLNCEHFSKSIWN